MNSSGLQWLAQVAAGGGPSRLHSGPPSRLPTLAPSGTGLLPGGNNISSLSNYSNWPWGSQPHMPRWNSGALPRRRLHHPANLADKMASSAL